MSYIVSLVALSYNRDQWFTQPVASSLDPQGINIKKAGIWDVYTHYDNIYFMYDNSYRNVLAGLRRNSSHHRAIFFVRPGELGLRTPSHTVRFPDGTITLCIAERFR